MPAIGWFPDLAAAKTYFTGERLITTAWDALATDALKTVAITMAYNRIYYSNLFSVPTYATATAAQLVILQKANAEMAYYLAQHLDDEDRRKGLQAQAVTAAGIVKENYKDSELSKIPIPPIVAGILDDFSAAAHDFYVSPVDRDEDDDDMEL